MVTYEMRSIAIKFVTNSLEIIRRNRKALLFLHANSCRYSKLTAKKALDLVGFHLFARRRDFIELLPLAINKREKMQIKGRYMYIYE